MGSGQVGHTSPQAGPQAEPSTGGKKPNCAGFVNISRRRRTTPRRITITGTPRDRTVSVFLSVKTNTTYL